MGEPAWKLTRMQLGLRYEVGTTVAGRMKLKIREKSQRERVRTFDQTKNVNTYRAWRWGERDSRGNRENEAGA